MQARIQVLEDLIQAEHTRTNGWEKNSSEAFETKDEDPHSSNEERIYRSLLFLFRKFFKDQKKSELLKQQEFEALAYFACHLKSIGSFPKQTQDDLFSGLLSSLIEGSPAVQPPAKVGVPDLDEDTYYEVIKAGYDLITLQHDPAKKKARTPAKLQLATPDQPLTPPVREEMKESPGAEKLPIAEGLLGKLFSMTPEISRGYRQTREKRQAQQAERYKWYVQLKKAQKQRQIAALTQSRDFIQSAQPWMTGFCLIPGVYFLFVGLPNVWSNLKKGNVLRAIGNFFGTLFISVLSPLAARKVYKDTGRVISSLDREISRVRAQSDDEVQVRVLPAKHYDQERGVRRVVNRELDQQPRGNPSRSTVKTEEVVERYEVYETSGNAVKKVDMVRVYTDKAKVQRNAAYARFGSHLSESKAAFDPRLFPDLQPSKVQSVKLSDAVYRAWETNDALQKAKQVKKAK